MMIVMMMVTTMMTTMMMIFFSFYFRFLLAKLNLTPGGLGLEALRLGPEEMAAQDDLQVASEKRPSDSLFLGFRKGRPVNQKPRHKI